MKFFLTSILDIYANIFTDRDYSTDEIPDDYPMTEAERGECAYYEQMARDIAQAESCAKSH